MQTMTPQFVVLTEDDYRSLIEGIHETVARAVSSQRGTNETPLLVKSSEMARLLSISENHLERMRKSGVVPSTTVGRSRRYCPQQVIETLTNGGTAK
ncbi:MAG: hypothetical protein Rhob2KO_14520 [Rhodopirellula baltica]